MLPLSSPKFSRGFTLIEIIAVIVVLSILAVLGGKFVVESTQAYQSTQTKSRLINTSRQALERMSRQLRIALPYSLRITNNSACLEFLPIASGGNYPDYVPDSVNSAAKKTTLDVSPHSIGFGTAIYVSIGAMAPGELYGASPSSLATLTSRSVNVINFSPEKGWKQNSINKRFYLLDRPQAFCIVNNQLRFYADQDVTAGEVNTNSAFSLLAENVTSPTVPFALTLGSENRNTIVQFNITFAQANTLKGGTESVNMNHSVMIRNVP
ncbi:type II secretion system protein J [Cellvibrio sp.]|uniref:PulJ/GspJ family protein n=1 Tax=Cellvibrio sp. TaxID=1965322 RepID=UPI003964877A